MHVVLYSQNRGRSVIGSNASQRITGMLNGISYRLHKNCAKEFREVVHHALTEQGWSDEVQINSSSRLTITAMKGRTGLCLQTGNVARAMYDLLKLQALYADERISSAIFLLPTKSAANLMGSNIANYERLSDEIRSVFHEVITVPILVIGFENEEEL